MDDSEQNRRRKLGLLRTLREGYPKTQEEAARYLGFGSGGRDELRRWEYGVKIPSEKYRDKFIDYLWTFLNLRKSPEQFEEAWRILEEVWGWASLSKDERKQHLGIPPTKGASGAIRFIGLPLLLIGAVLAASLAAYILIRVQPSTNRSARINVAPPFRLLEHVLDARWFNNQGLLPEGRPNAPGSGEAALRGPITLEDGRTYDRALFTHPKYGSDGLIRGEFDVPIVQNGQHFLTRIGFESNIGTNGVMVRVTFRNEILYERVKTLTSSLATIDVDMSRYAGQSGVLVIEVGANNDSGQDWFWWVDPRIDFTDVRVHQPAE
jgi:hypothetical protein